MCKSNVAVNLYRLSTVMEKVYPEELLLFLTLKRKEVRQNSTFTVVVFSVREAHQVQTELF